MKLSKFLSVIFAFVFLLQSQTIEGQKLPASTPSITTKTIISKWAAALGGANRAAQIGIIYRHSKIVEDGMEGERQEWVTAKLQRQEVTTRTHDQTKTVFDGLQGWINDWNGKTRLLQDEYPKQEVVWAILLGPKIKTNIFRLSPFSLKIRVIIGGFFYE